MFILLFHVFPANLPQCILDDIRAHRIPVDFLDLFDAADVPFYDGTLTLLCRCYVHILPGCMIVDLFDYRTRDEKPPRTRVLLNPDSESLWADVCSLNIKFHANCTDLDALNIEAKILVCLFIFLSLPFPHPPLDGHRPSSLSPS